jgi:hypothetical protein
VQSSQPSLGGRDGPRVSIAGAAVAAAASAVLALAGLLGVGGATASTTAPRVLRVGTYHGVRGQFTTIQAAVSAARPGDWILIAPGDYKTTASRAPRGHSHVQAAVLITTPRLHLRGMDRNSVVVDGTKPGSAECSRARQAQNFGPKFGKQGRTGLNGIMIYKADNVSVENLTACNFLNGPAGNGESGNGIWWNGGAGSGRIGGWGFYGAYLTATSTFYASEKTAAAYGIFSSNWSGGRWERTYTSNFNDSGLYIGACRQKCDQTVDHAWSEFNALGYSGSNSGGPLVVEHSQFDQNEDGFDTNSQNGDEPSPQNGACPKGVRSPIGMPGRCWVFMHNYVHDNNNPNIPSAGLAAAGPVGTGMSVSGGRNDTVMDNLFIHNGAWGNIFVPFPDSSGKPCTGGKLVGSLCLFDEYGDALLNNRYADNGFFGNPTNGDFGAGNLFGGEPTDCFHGNREVGGKPVKSSPSNAQQMYPKCSGKKVAADLNPPFLAEVACDAGVPLPGGTKPPCLPTDHYPRRTKIVMHPLPKRLKTMPNPCAGVPKNPWCKR